MRPHQTAPPFPDPPRRPCVPCFRSLAGSSLGHIFLSLDSPPAAASNEGVGVHIGGPTCTISYYRALAPKPMKTKTPSCWSATGSEGRRQGSATGDLLDGEQSRPRCVLFCLWL